MAKVIRLYTAQGHLQLLRWASHLGEHPVLNPSLESLRIRVYAALADGRQLKPRASGPRFRWARIEDTRSCLSLNVKFSLSVPPSKSRSREYCGESGFPSYGNRLSQPSGFRGSRKRREQGTMVGHHAIFTPISRVSAHPHAGDLMQPVVVGGARFFWLDSPLIYV